VLAAALAGAADLIASDGRRDLLPLGSYTSIPMLTARDQFEAQIEGARVGRLVAQASYQDACRFLAMRTVGTAMVVRPGFSSLATS